MAQQLGFPRYKQLRSDTGTVLPPEIDNMVYSLLPAWESYRLAVRMGNIAARAETIKRMLTEYVDRAVSESNLEALNFLTEYNRSAQANQKFAGYAGTDGFLKACLKGVLPVVKWWVANLSIVGRIFSDQAKRAVEETGRLGLVEILEFLLRKSGFRNQVSSIDNVDRADILQLYFMYLGAAGMRNKYTEDIMDKAAGEGNVEVLNWWLYSGLPCLYSHEMVDRASENGHLNVLEWWITARHTGGLVGMEFTEEYTSDALDMASDKGRIDVLSWWLYNGFELKYSEHALDSSSANGKMDVLEWWESSGLDLKYSTYAVDKASSNGNLTVLNWWKRLVHQRQYELKFSYRALDSAAKYGHIYILDWWKQSNFGLKFTYRAMDYASQYGAVESLEWLVQLGVNLGDKYTHRAIDWASAYGKIRVLDWWKKQYLETNLELKYTANAIDTASANGLDQVLTWWKNARAEIRAAGKPIRIYYSKHSINMASENRELDILNWWLDSGWKLLYTEDCLKTATEQGHIRVLEWWYDSGLELDYTPDRVGLWAAKLTDKNNSDKILDFWTSTAPDVSFEDPEMTYIALRTRNIKLLEWFEAHELKLPVPADGFLQRGLLRGGPVIREFWTRYLKKNDIQSV